MTLSRNAVSVTPGGPAINQIVSPSFTPPDASLILAIASGMLNGGNGNPAAGFSLANSASLAASLRATAGTSRDYGNGLAIWTLPVVTGASMTVTFNSTDTIQYGTLQLLTYTGHNVASPVGGKLETNGGPTDGAWNPTLDATPASDSEVIAAAHAVMASGTGGMDHGAGWTELTEQAVADWYVYQSQVRGSSTSTTVAWADTQAGASYYYGPIAVAIEIKAAGAGGGADPVLGRRIYVMP